MPENSIGACLEDEKVRQPRETEAYVRLSCLLYNVSRTSNNTWCVRVVLVKETRPHLIEGTPS